MTGRPENQASTPQLPEQEQGHTSLLWFLTVMLRERMTILAVTGIGTVIALVVALLRAPTYTTTFSFLPQATQDASRAGLINLAGQFGLPIGAVTGLSQSPQFYVDLLRTRAILAPIAADSFPVSDSGSPRVKLAQFLGASGSNEALELENTMRVLRQKVIGSSVATRGSGVVTVTARTRSPAVSFGVAERLRLGLNQFNLQTRQSQAGAERRFIEGRLADARDSLRAAEDALQRFLQANRQIENFSPLSFARDRIQRDVNLKQQLVNGLAQQYEDARIREVRDTPVITVIEQPSVAARPDAGERLMIFVTGTALALFAAVMLVLARAMFKGGSDRSSAAALLPGLVGDVRMTGRTR